MDLYKEEHYWRMKSAEWQHKYEKLQETLYNQWSRHQRQHDHLMEKLAAQQTNESDYIQKLEKENEKLEKTIDFWISQKKYTEKLMDELLDRQDHQSDYIQKIEDENDQLRAELKRENE